MPTRRFKSKEQQRIEAKLGVATSWGFSVKRDRASTWPPTERNDRPRDIGGFRCPDGRTMASKYAPESAIGAVKTHSWKRHQTIFADKPKAAPLENLPLSEKPNDLTTSKTVAVKNAYAVLKDLAIPDGRTGCPVVKPIGIPEHRTGVPVVKDTGKRGDGVVSARSEQPSSAVARQSSAQAEGSAGDDRPQAESQQPANLAR